MQAIPHRDNRSGFLEAVIIGGTTGIVTKTASAPIERVKILLQTQDEIVKAGCLSSPYKGAIDCVLRTYKNEGKLYKQITLYSPVAWKAGQPECMTMAA